MTAKELAEELKLESDFEKWKCIRLYSCLTGKGDGCFAEELAKETGKPVEAPDEVLWLDPSGRGYVAPPLNPQDPSEEWKPDENNKGSFRRFDPKGGSKPIPFPKPGGFWRGLFGR